MHDTDERNRSDNLRNQRIGHVIQLLVADGLQLGTDGLQCANRHLQPVMCRVITCLGRTKRFAEGLADVSYPGAQVVDAGAGKCNLDGAQEVPSCSEDCSGMNDGSGSCPGFVESASHRDSSVACSLVGG